MQVSTKLYRTSRVLFSYRSSHILQYNKRSCSIFFYWFWCTCASPLKTSRIYRTIPWHGQFILKMLVSVQ